MRHESTTATQSLTQFNSAFSLEAARWLAGAVLSGDESLSTEDRSRQAIESAYLRIFNRPAAADEVARARAFLAAQTERLRDEGRDAGRLATPIADGQPGDPFAAAAMVDFCLALFNANEFLYLE